MLRKFLTVLLLIIFFSDLHSQLAVFPANSDAEREQAILSLVGEGIEIGPVINVDCGTNTFGTYQFNGSLLGFEEGILLTTGSVANAPGPNTAGDASGNSNGGPVTFQPLNDLSNRPLLDLCVIEFELTPAGDEMIFDYVWASEEYPEYVCTEFNDIFAFFISGPRPAGGFYENQNIALLAGQPVSIGTINNGNPDQLTGCDDGTGCPCNPNWYVSNTQTDTEIGYDGFTKVLQASARTVPCEPYTLTLAIADADDDAWDSAIFLGANSLSSPAVVLETVTDHEIGGVQVGLEGCIDANIVINYDFDVSTTVNLFFEMLELGDPGIATPGDDYSIFLDGMDITGSTGSVPFPPGTPSQTLEFVIHEDNVIEGTESIVFAITGTDFCTTTQPVQSTVSIYEGINSMVVENLEEFDVCPTADPPTLIPLQIQALIESVGNTVSYEWLQPDRVDNPNLSSTFGTVPADATGTFFFECLVSLNGCTEIETVTVNILEDSEVEITGPEVVNVFVDDEESISLSGGGENAIYTWTPDQFLGSSTGKTNTVLIDDPNITSMIYNIEVANPTACTFGSFELTVNATVRPEVFLPSAFSPNGDAANDILMLQTKHVDTLVDWRIFNRWGNVVYESSGNLNEGWDGTYKGKTQDMGVYSYIITYRGFGPGETTETGQITLLK